MVMNKVGQRIREAREAAPMTQAQLALVLGVHQTQISRWENHEEPRAATLGKIAAGLRVTADLLLGIEGVHQKDMARLRAENTRLVDRLCWVAATPDSIGVHQRATTKIFASIARAGEYTDAMRDLKQHIDALVDIASEALATSRDVFVLRSLIPPVDGVNDGDADDPT